MTKLIYIDTETTSLRPDREPWEVALVRDLTPEQIAARKRRVDRDPGSLVDPEEYLARDWTADVLELDPDYLENADPFALKVGGFYDRHQQGRRLSAKHAPGGVHVAETARAPLEQPAVRIARQTHGATLVGINPSFDAETLDRYLRRHDVLPAWDYHLIDVRAMAITYLTRRVDGMRETYELDYVLGMSTDEMAHACGVPLPSEEDRHTALGDALFARRWFKTLTSTAQQSAALYGPSEGRLTKTDGDAS